MLSLIGIVAVASLLCNSGAWLWMAAKWCRIPNVSYLRALGAATLIAVINTSLQLAVPVGSEWAGAKPARLLAVVGLYLLVATVVAVVCVKVILRTTTIRALATGVITLAVSTAVAVPVGIAVKVFVMESFVVPTGSMALAVIGKHFDVICDCCGLPFVVSANERYQMQQRSRGLPSIGGLPHHGLQLSICPNCRAERSLPDDLPIAGGGQDSGR